MEHFQQNICRGSFGYNVSDPLTVSPNENDTRAEFVELSESIFMFPNKIIGEHGNVYEGEIKSSVYGARPCVIKFAALSEQIIREAEILTKLGSHSNIIAIIQSGIYCSGFDERVYIALDKCHSENLRQYLANRKVAGIEFDLNQAIDFAKQIIVGVMYIHDNNFIHLDLKPSNILISQNLRLIKIADFGLSIAVKSPKSKVLHRRQFGTNGYRPIESFGNGEVSQRTDIFSLGTVFLRLLSNGNDVFGPDEHAFIHNVTNDITDTSGLLVCNPKTTEHLIKCMVNKERCRRPNIWEVSDHPCWSGEQRECQFEYFADDEIDDCNDIPIEVEEGMTSLSDIEKGKQFLQKMREMGFNRRPTVVVFDDKSKHLHRFDHRDNSMTKMHKFPDGVAMDRLSYSAVSQGEHIYIFMHDRSVHRLEYCDVLATWTRMSDWIGDHGGKVPVVASSNAIFLVGGSFLSLPLKSVTKYDTLIDKWAIVTQKPTATEGSALMCHKNFLYNFGGEDEVGISDKVERMNLTTMEWSHVANMNKRRYAGTTSEFEGVIYMLGGYDEQVNHLNSAEMYNTDLNQWTYMKPMIESHSYFRIFWWDRNMFVIGGLGAEQSIEKYDINKDEWSIISKFPIFYESVLVSMSP